MAGQGTVLLIDDDPQSRWSVGTWLAEAGYGVLPALDGQEGLRLFFDWQPALVLLDVILPVLDGLELCRRVRDASTVPIVFLSALAAERERAAGLALGADDYLAKPAVREELLARVAAVLRRSGTRAPEGETFVDGLLRLGLAQRRVEVKGTPVTLTRIEFDILGTLVERTGEAVSLTELLHQVWGHTYEEQGLVKWHLARLRRKLEAAGLPAGAIASVRGFGYRYVRGVGKD